MRRPVLLFVLLLALAPTANAQVAQPQGVTLLSSAAASDYASAGARGPRTNPAGEGRGSVWPWLGVGALGGAAAGGVWGAWAATRGPDGYFPITVLAGAVAGALVGTLTGAIFYGITR